MAATAFISYAHADEKFLERLHKHLAVLKREGALAAWTDNAILPGARFEGAISSQLERSNLFVALVSPDYIASRYCYEKEFKRALALTEAGKMRIVPVILEPCDWLSTPLQEFLALPKDGQPISTWTNQNLALLDVVTGLRRVLEAPPEVRATDAGLDPGSGRAMRRPRIKQHFDTIQRMEFASQTFTVIREYFRVSCSELSGIDGLLARFEEMGPTAFTCTVVNRSRQGDVEANITVHDSKGRMMSFGDISYVNQRYADASTSNGAIRVNHDDYSQFLTLDALGYGGDKERLTPEQAADRLWAEFVKRAGIEYD